MQAPAATATAAAAPAAPSDVKCRVYVGNLSYRTRWQDLKDHFRQAGDVKRATIFQDHIGRSKGCGLVEFGTPAEALAAIQQLHDSTVPPDTERKIFVREDRDADPAAGVRGPGARDGAPAAAGTAGGFDAPANPRRARPQAAAAPAQATTTAASTAPTPTWVTPDGGRAIASATAAVPAAAAAAAASAPAPAAAAAAAPAPAAAAPAAAAAAPASATAAAAGGAAGETESIAGRQLYVSNLPWSTTWQELKDAFKPYGRVKHARVFIQNGRSKGAGTVLFETVEEANNALQMDSTDFQGRPVYVKVDEHAK